MSVIDADRNHSLAIRIDGRVWTWGGNASGQIGDGGTSSRLSPFQVPGVPASQAIGGGFRASYAIDNEGVVWSWGDNSDGQLGDNTTTSHSLAARIPSPANDDFFRLSGTDTRPDVFSFNPAFGVTPITQTGSNVITVGGLRNGVSSPVTVTGGEVSINGGAFSAVGASVVNGNTVQVRAMSSSAFSTTDAGNGHHRRGHRPLIHVLCADTPRCDGTFSKATGGGGEWAQFHTNARWQHRRGRVQRQWAIGQWHDIFVAAIARDRWLVRCGINRLG